MKPENKGFKRIWKAFGYSLSGLRATWAHESAFRQEVILVIGGTIIACFLDIPPVEQLFLILTLFLVPIVELLNSAIENTIDRIGPEFHELSGRAKDTGSAAVLITLILAAVVWSIVLWNNFL